MSEKVIKAVTIRSSDYKDNDKIVKLFTPEGILNAQIKGVKKAGAKLKFCVQPFCFSELVLHDNKGFLTVTGAELLDSFFDLTQDYECYMAACTVLESIDAFAGSGSEAFILVLKTLSAFLTGKPKEILIKYFLEALRITGYEYEYNHCSQCGKAAGDRFWFDLESGLMCGICKPPDAVPVSKAAQSVIRITGGTTFDKLATVKLNEGALIEALMLIGVIYREKNGIGLKSLKELVNA